MKVTYVWHDCFVVELPGLTLVFDYWLDAGGRMADNPSFLAALRRDVPVIVLVSHFHKDHYNPAIFGWQAAGLDVSYVVSLDVWKRMRHIISPTSVYRGPKVSAASVSVLRPGDSCSLYGATIKAFPSTDAGNSYMVEADGVRVFHAGDLNAWVFRDDSTQQEINKALGDFKACLRSIKKEYPEENRPHIHTCFFPIDSRIGSGYMEGAHIFLDNFNVDTFYPMHYELATDDAEREQRHADVSKFCDTISTQILPPALHKKC